MIIQQPEVKQDQELEGETFSVQSECVEHVFRADKEPLQRLTDVHGGFSTQSIYRQSGSFSDIKDRGSRGLEWCFNIQLSFIQQLMSSLL